MWTLKLLLISALVACACAFSVETPAVSTVTKYEVCLSPGCLADGAQQTLDKLQALAPPGNLVVPGVCCSLCGNGPVVMSPNEKTTTKHRRVRNKKIFDLFLDESEPESIPEPLIQGFEASLEAEEAFQKNDFEKAAGLFETAVETAFEAAMDLQSAREEAGTENVAKSGIPAGLLWLVQARRNEATAKLELGDVDGAALAAQASCEIAQNKCADSLEVLANVYEKMGDTKAELDALNIYFDLPVEDNLPTQVANKRRALGFRKQRLE